MRYPLLCLLCSSLSLALVPARAEEPAGANAATGTVTATGYGAFAIGDQRFNLSSKSTQYEPATWRPTAGDEVKVVFTRTQKRNDTLFAVAEVSLLKAGPDTVVSLESPVTVDIVESGRTGVKARVPKGQVIKFARSAKTRYVPGDWTPLAGQKAKIEFKADPAKVGFGVTYIAERIEKVE